MTPEEEIHHLTDNIEDEDVLELVKEAFSLGQKRNCCQHSFGCKQRNNKE